MDEDDLGEDDGNGKLVKKPRTDEEDEKRKNFLERNRLGKGKSTSGLDTQEKGH
jgi:hypothetical protein